MVKSAGYMLLTVATLGPAASAAEQKGKQPPNWGQRKEVAWDALKKDFKNPDMIYAPFIFWFWDEPLNAAKMAEMSRVMCSEGFNPGYAHARQSMVGTPNLPEEQWLTAPWFQAFGGALNEAEKQQAYLGYCDEYWWPSFQAHGRLLKQHPELKPESLNWQILEAAGGSEIKVPASFFAVAAQVDDSVTVKPPEEPLLGQWIWHPDAQPNAHTCWFRKSFIVPAGKAVSRAEMRITADNSFALYVNGKRVGESVAPWMTVASFDLGTALTPGENVLAVEAKNVDGAFGLIAGLLAKLDDGGVLEIRSDQTWLTSLAASEGFERVAFDAAKWRPAREIAKAGGSPWNSVTNPDAAATILSKTLQVIGNGEAFIWKAPQAGAWRVYAFNKYSAPGIDGGAVNAIDDRLAGAFIEIALEPYARRLGDKLGKSIPGDFIDHEGDYGRQLAWSDTLDQRFNERHGRDIRLSLPLMLDQDAEGRYAKARWEWFDLVSDLYAGNFKAITDWHEKRGMYTTAHVWEEGLAPQVNAVGDHMKFLRALTMPGQDCLGRKALEVHDFKEIESVAEFQNARATTELLGAAGWGPFTPSFLKQSINAVTAWGMSHVIPHGVFTARKLMGNPWPPDWYSESPMFPYMHLWTDFARRASYVNSMGCAVPDVLLYNPLETAWIHASAPLLDADMWSAGRRINALDQVYVKAINDLTGARVEFLIGDRFYLKQMEVKNAQLVRGGFSFRTLVLPPLEILTLDSARKIVDFAKSGGRVYALGSLPGASAENGMGDPKMKELMDALRAPPTFSTCKDGVKPLLDKGAPGLESPITFASGKFKMLQHRRRIAGMDFFWLANNAQRKQVCEIRVRGVKGAASLWNCETGETKAVGSTDTPGGSTVKLVFEPLEAYWLVFDPKSPAQKVAKAPAYYGEWLTLSGPWQVTFKRESQPVMEFPTEPPAIFAGGMEKALESWSAWEFPNFSGVMEYAKVFDAGKAPGPVSLDLGKVCYAAEVWVNGKAVGEKLWGPYVFDVSTALRPGENEIRVRVANLINNSYGDSQESGLFGPVVLRTPQAPVSNEVTAVNLATDAKVTACSTYAGYSPERVNDGDSSTALGGEASWANADGPGLPQWVELAFGSEIQFNAVEFFTTENYVLKDFQLEYWNGKDWRAASERIGDNTAVCRSLKFPTVTASKLRVMCYRGPDKQPSLVRVNEIEVYYQP